MPAADERPIGNAELGALFGGFAPLKRLALAVSGGADSLALMLLIRRWRETLHTGPHVLVLTVDHGLRAGSAAEAAMVAREAARLGFAHRTLVWDGAKPDSRIEERAREARYRLLADACREAGIADLLAAHHRDDQAETVLMRLGKGSGLAGLAGMRPSRELGDGLRLHRPLLGLSRSRLAATVAEAGLTPVVDGSNADPQFARPRLRALAGALDAAGLPAAGIAASAERLAAADAAVDHYVDRFLAEAVAIDGLAVARIDRRRLCDAPREVRQRALRRVIATVGDGGWPPVRRPRLVALEAAIVSGGVRRTLGGAVVTGEDDRIVVHREPGRSVPLHVAVSGGQAGVWDRRFAYRVEGEGDFTLAPLGEDGRRELGLKSSLAPRGALAALPALRLGGDIVSVPPIGFHRIESAFTAKCIAGGGLWSQTGG